MTQSSGRRHGIQQIQQHLHDRQRPHSRHPVLTGWIFQGHRWIRWGWQGQQEKGSGTRTVAHRVNRQVLGARSNGVGKVRQQKLGHGRGQWQSATGTGAHHLGCCAPPVEHASPVHGLTGEHQRKQPHPLVSRVIRQASPRCKPALSAVVMARLTWAGPGQAQWL